MGMWRNKDLRREVGICVIIGTWFTIIGFILNAKTGILVLIASFAFLVLTVLNARRRYRRIGALADEIDRILHGGDAYRLDRFSEGELSILESELSKMTATLRQQAETLENDKLYLADSLADISHQLKTPLTSINLAIAMLAAPELTDARRAELTRDVARSLSRMEWLVSSLLKMSRLDAGTAELAREHVAVEELIRQSAAPLAIAMELRGVRLVLDPEGVESFTGDPAWTAEALGNILKNCMEHTPADGTITVRTRENAIFTEITVQDTGGGFAPEDLPHLFERFYRGKNASRESAGIGLALARMIVVNQGGSIQAENVPTGGARFVIRFYKSIV